MDWWGYSKRYGWLFLDCSIPSNSPPLKGNLKFVICSDDKVLDIHFDHWVEPQFISAKKYLESFSPPKRKIEGNFLNTHKGRTDNYKKILLEPAINSELELPDNIAKHEEELLKSTLINRKSTMSRFFGIGTDGAMFVWFFWGFLGMLIAPPLGVMIILLLLGINIIDSIDEYREKKKRLQKTGELLNKHFTPLPQHTPANIITENKVRRSIKCNRCGGSGKLPQFTHIQNGVCFRCNGSGLLTNRV
jgi:hypothetical protein